jgi:hypothetical protein
MAEEFEVPEIPGGRGWFEKRGIRASLKALKCPPGRSVKQTFPTISDDDGLKL